MMMSSPRPYCLIFFSAVLLIIFCLFIDATVVVDAFTVPVPATSNPPAAKAINYHNRDKSKHFEQQNKRIIMTLNSSKNNNKDDDDITSLPSTAFFDRATTLIGKSASSIVSLSFFALLSTKRDALTTTLFIGSILNAISGKILKKILNHDRPAELELSNKVKLKPSDGGMPSSHAMSLSFIGTVILFGVIVPATATASNNNMIGIAAGTLMVIYSAIALRYRVRDHLHTLEQIVVGYGIGLFNAIIWLKLAIAEPIVTMVQQYLISSDTNQFPLIGLMVPILVGVVVVGSFERRIGMWLKKDRKEEVEDSGEEKMK